MSSRINLWNQNTDQNPSRPPNTSAVVLDDQGRRFIRHSWEGWVCDIQDVLVWKITAGRPILLKYKEIMQSSVLRLGQCFKIARHLFEKVTPNSFYVSCIFSKSHLIILSLPWFLVSSATIYWYVAPPASIGLTENFSERKMAYTNQWESKYDKLLKEVEKRRPISLEERMNLGDSDINITKIKTAARKRRKSDRKVLY